MPSIKAYTQYETLAFCQSVAYHGSDTTAFDDISAALNGNHLIREDVAYDQTRLTAAALQTLYDDLLTEEKNAQTTPVVNGDGGSTNGTNPRKRKLSTSPAPSDSDQTDEQRLLHSVMDKLYARFRQQIIDEIRQEEDEYQRIQDEVAHTASDEPEEQKREMEAIKDNNQDQQQTQQLDTADKTSQELPTLQSKPESAATSLTPSVDAGQVQQATSNGASPAHDAKTSPSSARSGQQQTLAPFHHPPTVPPALAPGRAPGEPGQPRPLPPPLVQSSQHSPGAFNRTLPIPSPQRPNYGPINPQHFQPGPQGQPVPVLQPYTGSPHMPPPAEYPPQKRGSSSSTQGRGSPIPAQFQQQQQQPYPGYPGYPQQPPWPHHSPAQQYAQAPPPFPNQPYYVQSPPGRPPPLYQTPHHPQYAPYPQSAPIHYPGQQPPAHAWPPPQPGQPYYGYQGSANITPLPRSESKQAALRGRSSTPWKKRSQPTSGGRPASPTRPEREVSPISDTESSARLSKGKSPLGKLNDRIDKSRSTLRDAVPPARGRQQASATPSAFAGSRSQSRASFTSDTPTDRRKKGAGPHRIKAEPPTTPAAIPSDTEMQPNKTTSRRGRPRSNTRASKTEPTAPGASSTNKRKRSSGGDSATPPQSITRQLLSSTNTASSHLQQAPRSRQLPQPLLIESSLIPVTKNFSKTALLFLNDANSHKLAGIFAKPVSERDAPGYKETVLRPQDLKSIKAAISKGGKAAQAAIEAFEEKMGSVVAAEEDENNDKTPTRTVASTTTKIESPAGERALGNGVYLLKASEDLAPPKTIVNSAQLEMELVRIFANAIMFNPLPSSERGFGHSLRLRKRGGDVAPQHHEDEDDQQVDGSESDASSPSEAGGIISDTREMFEDVMAMLRKWREAEDERFGIFGEADLVTSTPVAGPSKPTTQVSGSGNVSVNISATASLRQSESVEKEDDGGRSNTPAAYATGTARKRRRVADT